MKPSVGRVVHFRGNEPENAGKCVAAIVTEVVGPELIHLTIFKAEHVGARLYVREGDVPGSWHWPKFNLGVPSGICSAHPLGDADCHTCFPNRSCP